MRRNLFRSDGGFSEAEILEKLEILGIARRTVRDVFPLGIVFDGIIELRRTHGKPHHRFAARAPDALRIRIAIQDSGLDLPLQAIPFFARRLIPHRRLL